MDENATIVEWELKGTGLDLDHFGWPEFREFLNRLTAVLEVLPSGPHPKFVLPTQATTGSVRVATRMQKVHLPAVEALVAGPTGAWTSNQRRRAEPLYEWTRRRGVVLSVATASGAERRIVHVPATPVGAARELTTLRGEVHRAGGKDGTVDVRFPGDGIVHCDAGRALAEQLGAHLYHQVDVTGRATRDGLGRLVGFEIESFRPADTVMTAARAMAELHAKVGSALDELDPQAILAERRT